MRNTPNLRQRILRDITYGPAALRLTVIVLAVISFFFVGFRYRGFYLDGFIASALIYTSIVLAYILLDLSYRSNDPNKVLVRMTQRFLAKHEGSAIKKEVLKDELNFRLQSSYIKNFLREDRFEEGLIKKEIDEVDEAIRIINYLNDVLEKDPKAKVTIFVVHVTKAQVDEEFNFWRSLKAIYYLEKQIELISTKTSQESRAQIWRFFITDRKRLTIKALSVIAHHRFWGINTIWGVRDDGECNLPIHDFGNMLFASVEGENPFQVALLVKFDHKRNPSHEKTAIPNADAETHRRSFITDWSFLVKPGYQSYASRLGLEDRLKEALTKAQNSEGFDIIDEDKIDSVLEEMGETPNACQSYAKAYLTFRRVRRRIPKVSEILAVDLTSIKKSLSVLRQNPGYLEWQEECFRQILRPPKKGESKRFDRCYVIDPDKHDTLDYFIEILNYYFERLVAKGAASLPREVNIYYTSIKAIEDVIRKMLPNVVKENLTKLSNINDQLTVHERTSPSGINAQMRYPLKGDQSDINSLGSKDKAELYKLMVRDFLCTDDFIYDYINPDADVDDTTEEEYMLINKSVLKGKYEHIIQAYKVIFGFLTHDCGAAKVRVRGDINRQTIRESLNSPSIQHTLVKKD